MGMGIAALKSCLLLIRSPKISPGIHDRKKKTKKLDHDSMA